MAGIDILFILFFAYIFTCIISAVSINLVIDTKYGMAYKNKLTPALKFADRLCRSSAIWMPIFNLFVIFVCAKIYIKDYFNWLNRKLDNDNQNIYE